MSASQSSSVGAGAGAGANGGLLPPPINPMNQPSSLQLSRSQVDGSLLTSSLEHVIIASTDALYEDLFQMSSGGEIPILQASTSSKAATTTGEDSTSAASSQTNTPVTTPQPSGTYPNQRVAASTIMDATVRRDNLANLSFAKRRHELSIRLFRHLRALQHVTALVSSYSAVTDGSSSSASSTASTSQNGNKDSSKSSTATSNSTIRPESVMGLTIMEASDSLKNVYQKMMGADEAQDALYFHHAELWKTRRHVHDVHGALQVFGNDKGWVDLPTDLLLRVDKYFDSNERYWSKDETQRRLQSCVRRKLVFGEIGQLRKRQLFLQQHQSTTTTHNGNKRRPASSSFTSPWNITMEKSGCAIRLTYGISKQMAMKQELNGGDYYERNQSTTIALDGSHKDNNNSLNNDDVYPIEARLTVLSEEEDAPWTLLTLDIAIQPKTGESSHQLDLNNRQRFQLHKLCAQSMTREEQRFQKAKNQKRDDYNSASSTTSSAKRAKVGDEKKTKEGDTTTSKEDELMSEGGVGSTGSVVDHDSIHEQQQSATKNLRTTRLSCSLPLKRLFDVSHTFAMSLQLEMLSAQADALKRGAWGSSSTSTADGGSTEQSNSNTFGGLQVSRIRYVEGPLAMKAKILMTQRRRQHRRRRITTTKKKQRTGADDVSTIAGDDDDIVMEEGGDDHSTSQHSASTNNNTKNNDMDDNDEDDEYNSTGSNLIKTEAFMAIHFWSCDDRLGAPKIRDVSSSATTDINNNNEGDDEDDETTRDVDEVRTILELIKDMDESKEKKRTAQKLTLLIRAVSGKGLVVSLPGGEEIMSHLLSCDEESTTRHNSDATSSPTKMSSSDYHYVKRFVDKLHNATQNPFALSAADAILASTVLCAHYKCVAAVKALNKYGNLPSWMTLTVEAGVISVSISIVYNNDAEPTEEHTSTIANHRRRTSVPVFRLSCDTRTGKFVPLFPSCMMLLRALSCNDLRASDIALMQTNALASANSIKRRAIGNVGKDLTGRLVKEGFDGLTRSMDNLSDKAGVGDTQWEDMYAPNKKGPSSQSQQNSASTTKKTGEPHHDTNNGIVENGSHHHKDVVVPTTEELVLLLSPNAKLRAKSVDIACHDVKRSLQVCCGMAALYGIAACALTIACGVDAVVDLAGGPPTTNSAERNISSSPPCPPVAVVLEQTIGQKEVAVTTSTKDEADDEEIPFLQRQLVAATVSIATITTNTNNEQQHKRNDETRLSIQFHRVTSEVYSPKDIPKCTSFESQSLKYSETPEESTPDNTTRSSYGLNDEINYLSSRILATLQD